MTSQSIISPFECDIIEVAPGVWAPVAPAPGPADPVGPYVEGLHLTESVGEDYYYEVSRYISPETFRFLVDSLHEALSERTGLPFAPDLMGDHLVVLDAGVYRRLEDDEVWDTPDLQSLVPYLVSQADPAGLPADGLAAVAAGDMSAAQLLEQLDPAVRATWTPALVNLAAAQWAADRDMEAWAEARAKEVGAR